MPATDDEARELARAIRGFLSWVHDGENEPTTRHEVVRLIRDHLGDHGTAQSVVTREVPAYEQVNVQVALDAWSSAAGRTVAVHGLAIPPHYGGVNLQQMLHGEALPPVRLSAPDLVDLPAGPDRTIACLRRALLLVEDARGAYVVFLRGPVRHEEPMIAIELAGLPTAAAQEVFRELDALRAALNVFRGQLLELDLGSESALFRFPVLPTTVREDVVLPEIVLRRIERHTLDVAARREALLAAHQHLKRGLLLHGPPGTGKTHTTRYLVQALQGATVFLLSGRSLHMIGMVTELARDLQPAVVVLEDVDLVAEDRGFGPGSSPVLFELLDAMDGAASDADLLFLLTTNRADLLEPALAARPGRVDVAVEIGLPDAACRRRLFELYSRDVELAIEDDLVDELIDRTEGVTASFVKELIRRAVLEALTGADGAVSTVSGADLTRALDDLLDSGESVTRALLGVPADQTGPPAVPGRQLGPYGGRGMGGHHSRLHVSSGTPPGAAFGYSD